MAAFPKYTALHQTSGTTNLKKGSPGVLYGVSVNKALTGTVTVSDAGTTLGILTNGTTAPLGMNFATGAGGMPFQNLSVACSATEDITIFYE